MDTGFPSSKRRRQLKRRLIQETALSRRFEFETLEPRVLMSASFLPVHGSLDAPGQVNKYSFNLATPTNLYFDTLTPQSNNIDWTLQGPQGTVVNQQSFAQSDGINKGGTATLSLVPGTYTLSVAGQNSTTGTYDFDLLNLAAATPIALGQHVDGTLNPGDSTAAYSFSGTAGEQVFFDSHALEAQNTAWRVVGPDNTLTFGPNGLGQDPNTVTLDRTGTYTVLIEGNVNQTSAADYSFTVYPAATNQYGLSLGTTTAGNLQTPGQTDTYSFSVGQTTNVLFDSLTQNGNINWTLTGTGGDLVSQRAFNQSDAGNISGDSAVSLAPGDYTLTVAGSNSTTGLYGFQLLDLSTGTPTDLSTTVSGTIGDAGYAAQALHVSPGAPLSNAQADVALSLDDAGVNATVPNSTLLQPGTLTVEAWVNPDFNAGGTMDIVRQGAPGAGYALQVGNDGHLQFDLDGTILEAPAVLRQGVWTQVAATYDGTAMHLIVAGQDVADQAFAGPITYDTNGLIIGAQDGTGTNRFQGSIDELRVWTVARSPSDIASTMNQELGPPSGAGGRLPFQRDVRPDARRQQRQWAGCHDRQSAGHIHHPAELRPDCRTNLLPVRAQRVWQRHGAPVPAFRGAAVRAGIAAERGRHHRDGYGHLHAGARGRDLQRQPGCLQRGAGAEHRHAVHPHARRHGERQHRRAQPEQRL